MEEWRNGGMEEWWNGGMAEWRNGGMAEWRNGGMAEWRKSFSTVPCFRIWGHFPPFRALGFGVIFRHSAIPPFRHSAIPPFRHSTIPPFRLLGRPFDQSRTQGHFGSLSAVWWLVTVGTSCMGYYYFLNAYYVLYFTYSNVLTLHTIPYTHIRD